MTETDVETRFTRRQELAETCVFLLLILPSMAFSLFAVGQGDLSFPLVASFTMLRDVSLVALIVLFLSRDRQSVAEIGWVPRNLLREVALGVCLLKSRTAAVLLSAVVFSIGHGYEGTAGVITVLLTGVALALVYVWRRSLVAPMVIHFLVNLNALVVAPAFLR